MSQYKGYFDLTAIEMMTRKVRISAYVFTRIFLVPLLLYLSHLAIKGRWFKCCRIVKITSH